MLDIDFSNVKESQEFSILPEGEYTLKCVNAEVKETKSGGELIKCQFVVTSGPRKGASVFEMFNIKNNNSKAVEIGLSKLKAFLKCAGKETAKLTDVKMLEGLECNAIVKIRKSNDFPDQNTISYFKEKKVKTVEEKKLDEEPLPF